MNPSPGPPPAGAFELAVEGDTFVVTPVGDMSELAFQEVEAGGRQVMEFFERAKPRNVVVDLGRIDFTGSTALGLFIRLWKRVRTGQGQMAFCNVSDHQKEIFEVTNLSALWQFCDSREAALRALSAGT